MTDRAGMTDREGLVLEGVSIAVDGERLIDGLDLAVPPGQVVTLMGPSGCGKSSLLAYIGGALDDRFEARGRIRLDGRRVDALPPERRRIGILFQDDLLFPHMSVGDNLAFAMPRRIKGRKARRARVAAALASMGLEGFAERDPATLSGGQRSRVALLRALMAEPQALLLDEPFSALDARLRAEVRSLVLTRLRASGLPTLLVTHDPEDAAATEDRVLRPWDA